MRQRVSFDASEARNASTATLQPPRARDQVCCRELCWLTWNLNGLPPRIATQSVFRIQGLINFEDFIVQEMI